MWHLKSMCVFVCMWWRDWLTPGPVSSSGISWVISSPMQHLSYPQQTTQKVWRWCLISKWGVIIGDPGACRYMQICRTSAEMSMDGHQNPSWLCFPLDKAEAVTSSVLMDSSSFCQKPRNPLYFPPLFFSPAQKVWFSSEGKNDSKFKPEQMSSNWWLAIPRR